MRILFPHLLFCLNYIEGGGGNGIVAEYDLRHWAHGHSPRF